MSVLHVHYDMEVHYAQPVGRSFFTIKCTPVFDQRQKPLHVHMEMTPEVHCNTGKDSFGNIQTYGCIFVPHESFRFQMSGDVETQNSPEVGTESTLPCGVFRYPHGKCMPWKEAEEFLQLLEVCRCHTDYDRCIVILKALGERFSYVKNSTTVYTTAEEAWEKGCGVCQDYAHIYITLLRMAGIPARYVCGFILGEGESHAWVEAFCEGRWIALDPTLGCVLTDQYIKLGHGRDAADCSINRGIIWGGGMQEQFVSVRVEQ